MTMIQKTQKGPHSSKCPCGCANLSQDDSTKRHLSILLVVVLIATCGLVALSAYERNYDDNGQEVYGGGASQAAEQSSYPNPAPTAMSQYAMTQPQFADQQFGQAAQPGPGMLRQEEVPSIMVVPVVNGAGVTRLKRIVSR